MVLLKLPPPPLAEVIVVTYRIESTLRTVYTQRYHIKEKIQHKEAAATHINRIGIPIQTVKKGNGNDIMITVGVGMSRVVESEGRKLCKMGNNKMCKI